MLPFRRRSPDVHARHQAARTYARALEIVGYAVALLGGISGIAQMFMVGFFPGLYELLLAIVIGIGLVVLGELVLVFFNIEQNTAQLLEAVQGPEPATAEEGAAEQPRPRPPSTAH